MAKLSRAQRAKPVAATGATKRPRSQKQGMLDITKARDELRRTTLLDIERATALTWGGRAAASYTLVLEERDAGKRIQRFWEGEGYRQEALEHAAMTEDFDFLEELSDEVEAARARARPVLGLPATAPVGHAAAR